MVAVIFDTESSGLTDPRLIEAAWIRVPDAATLDTQGSFFGRYNPGKPIELGALATHHIYDEELADCPPYTEFALPADIQYLVGHNIDYDWKVIGQPNVKRICTLALCRHLLPGLDSYSQSAMLYHLERRDARVLLKGAHSAAADIQNYRLILLHLLPRIYGSGAALPSWESLWEFSEKARIPTVMPFGKHKGIEIVRIPQDYKRWLMGQPDIDPYLMKALKPEAA
jgi:exodeoxyribonuclease X